jgi:hypothetical protein
MTARIAIQCGFCRCGPDIAYADLETR